MVPSSIAIVTDKAADLPEEYLKRSSSGSSKI